MRTRPAMAALCAAVSLCLSACVERPAADAAASEAPPAALDERRVENLTAFARLYGYVRFFHPSDEAAAADWDALALAGVERAESAQDGEALRQALLDVFLPVAPTLRIERGAPPQTAPQGGHFVAWRHRGLTDQTARNIYRSTREAPPPGLPHASTLALPGGFTASTPLIVGRGPLGATLPRATQRALPMPRPEGFAPHGGDRTSRLASVIAAWNVLQHFYPYWDAVDADWAAALQTALSQAATDADEDAFDATLDRMLALSGDGHAQAARTLPRGMLGLQWAWIEDRLIVTATDAAEEQKPDGLRVGDEVTEIDGRPAAAAIAEQELRMAAATPAFRRVKALQWLAIGPRGETRTLGVTRADGTRAEIVLRLEQRDAAPPERRPPALTELAPGLVYADLTRLGLAEFEANLDRLAGAQALIFDVRGYPQGGVAPALLAHLSDETITSARFNTPVFTQPDQEGAAFETDNWVLPPRTPRFAAARVAFLTDARAISYAESVMGVVEGHALGEIVGEATPGTNGNIGRFVLPTGHTLIWTGMQVRKHDGSPHHGVGIQPTVPAVRTAAGIRDGGDEVLEAAMRAVGGRQP